MRREAGRCIYDGMEAFLECIGLQKPAWETGHDSMAAQPSPDDRPRCASNSFLGHLKYLLYPLGRTLGKGLRAPWRLCRPRQQAYHCLGYAFFPLLYFCGNLPKVPQATNGQILP